MKHARWFMGVVMVIGLAARPLAAQALENVPAKSLVVIKVKNLQETSKKVAKLANDLGVAAMAPALNDPLKALEDKTKISQGLNTGGDLLVAFLDPTGSNEPPDKSMVILVPVSDYKAFLANFPDAQTEGDVSQVKLGENPEPGYVANWG
ncbi:MAG: hypothetical protein JO353_00595, partial [Phycisphaerae bacterium]|nr:hypothetical protein [Phycisphaerae bacterium]